MKTKTKPPKTWLGLKKRIKRKIREEIKGKNITRKHFGLKSISKTREKRLIRLKLNRYLKSALKRKQGESEAEWKRRCKDFASWVFKDYPGK